MKRCGLMALLGLSCLVLPAVAQSPAPFAPSSPVRSEAATGQTIGEEVLLLRRRVETLEQRLALLEAVLDAALKKPGVPASEAKADRVGQILIIGNSRTPRDVILSRLPLTPDQPFTERDLRAAERSLERMNRFVVDPSRNVRPTVAVLNPASDSPIKDILVTVREK